MNKKIYLAIGLSLLVIGGAVTVFKKSSNPHWPQKRMTILNDENEELEAENSYLRAKYEWTISRDLRTGQIPEGIRAKELEWLRSQPVNNSGLSQSLVSNSYDAAGPTQNGGRTRTVVFDKRANKVVLAGGISGGIFRSEDNGATWKFVHPVNEVRSVSSIAQDPTNPDTWYAGTGEAIGVSAGYPNAFVYGNGILKSTDNGKTWTVLPSTADNIITNFGFYDIVHKIVVHPKTGHVYVAIHRSIVKSTDGGTTWKTVLACNTNLITSSAEKCPATSSQGMGDIAITADGSKIYAAMSGRNLARHLVGIWESSTGDSSSFTRIAGGLKDAADSVAGWRNYDNSTNTSGDYTAGWGRIVLALSPSNQNIMFALIENGQSAASSKSEADLFKVDMTSKPYKWSGNLGENLVAKKSNNNSASNKYMELQGGYNMMLAVHPKDPNTVLAGGVNLFRSTDAFVTKDNVTFIGGIASDDTYTDNDGASHADQHSFAFDPLNPSRVLIGSDGGIGSIDDVTAAKPNWTLSASQYQTIQYYHVGIDPTNGSRTFYGGAQDNSTTLRDRTNLLSPNLPDSNDHYILLGGDGCQVGMTKKDASNVQNLICAAQQGQIYRIKLLNTKDQPFTSANYTKIKPDSTGEGEFVTYFHLDPDNTDYLYYASDDTLFRTSSSTTVTSSTWTLMKGVANTLNGSIYALETSRGKYTANSHLFIGTGDGKIYKLKDPLQTSATTAPVDITPSTMSPCSNNVCAIVRDIAVNPRNQDTVMAVVSNYGANSIFWTGNATAASPTWQMIEGNVDVPSVRACEIIVKTIGVEYYIGTSVGLFSTTKINGTSTAWAREVGTTGKPTEMLNTAIINSLASRWSDNTLVIGTHGNGMFSATLGSPIAASSITTAVYNPVRDNASFINNVYPTVTNNTVNYKVGNMYGMRKMSVTVTNLNGAVVFKKESSYEDGAFNLANMPAGTYILTITSADRKYQTVKRIIKQ